MFHFELPNESRGGAADLQTLGSWLYRLTEQLNVALAENGSPAKSYEVSSPASDSPQTTQAAQAKLSRELLSLSASLAELSRRLVRDYAKSATLEAALNSLGDIALALEAEESNPSHPSPDLDSDPMSEEIFNSDGERLSISRNSLEALAVANSRTVIRSAEIGEVESVCDFALIPCDGAAFLSL